MSRVRHRFRSFCCDVWGTASSEVAEASAVETFFVGLTCNLVERSFPSSSSLDILRRFLCSVARGLSADSGGVGSQSAWCGLRGRSSAATIFPGSTLVPISFPPLSLSSSLSLPSSEVAPSSSSSAFNSALRFSLTSGGVRPMGYSSAAPRYMTSLHICSVQTASRCSSSAATNPSS
ncbi:hypothetical protein GQ44DRAFT_714319 [Phaeosphaeriaceae sp. PMI808]|nr:hypothetical protein GQ44DRAFT_714319 [Phaeosphaeriaceae sp. PMI808]